MAASEPDAASAALIAALLADDDAVLARNFAIMDGQTATGTSRAAATAGNPWPAIGGGGGGGGASHAPHVPPSTRPGNSSLPARATWAGRVAERQGQGGGEGGTAAKTDGGGSANEPEVNTPVPTPEPPSEGAVADASALVARFLSDVRQGKCDFTGMDWATLCDNAPPWLLSALKQAAQAYANDGGVDQ